MPPAKKQAVEPKLIEIKVSRGYGIKINLGNYESADTHVSESETWDVTGLPEDEVDALRAQRSEDLETRLRGHLADNGDFLESLKNED